MVSAAMNSFGCMIVEGALPEEYVRVAVPELESAIAQEAKWHGTTDYQDYGMVSDLLTLWWGVLEAV